MSIEISILSDSRLGSIAELQHAIDVEGFPLRLPAEAALDPPGGMLSAYLRDKLTVVRYRIEDSRQLMEAHKEIVFGRDWKYLVSLPWIVGFDQFDAAWIIAAAYACATGGAVFDPQEGRLLSSDEARQVVQEMGHVRPQAEAVLQTFVQEFSAKSPAAEAALHALIQRHSTKSDEA